MQGRGCINFLQFSNLVQELGIMSGDLVSQVFDDALNFLEQEEEFKRSRLLSVSSTVEILLFRTIETVPYYNIIRNKFSKRMSFKKGGVRPTLIAP